MAGISPSLKSLDPVRLLAAKGKIFNIVQDYELQQLCENSKLRRAGDGIDNNTSSDTTHVTLSEEEGSYGTDGPSNVLRDFQPTLKSPSTITDNDTNLSYFQF